MKILLLTVIMVLAVTIGNTQNTEMKSKKKLKAEKKALQITQIKAVIESKNFIFKAYSVIPKNEKTKSLTTDFGIEVRNDSIYSYMPYYGNTYSRDYSTFKDSPMGFMQPIDSYKKEKTKSGYDLRIKVKNLNDLVDLTFHISKTGSTSVVASSINRQSISYMGEIIVPQPKE